MGAVMQLGLVGLGRMGGNMAERLRAAGHDVVGYDTHAEASNVSSLAELVEKLAAPRIVWIMVPAGDATRDTVAQLGDLLAEGDMGIDGSNSRFTDDQKNAALLAWKSVHSVD